MVEPMPVDDALAVEGPAAEPAAAAEANAAQQQTPEQQQAQQQQQQAEYAAEQRSKKQQQGGKGKSKGRGAENREYVGITENLAEHVRRIRVDPKKETLDERHAVLLSKGPAGKAPQLTLSEDRLSATGYKGFRTVRCNHGCHVGTWYCEARVAHTGTTGHARLGWVTSKAELQAPVGFDAHGYCYRDLEGSRVHQGLREPYGAAFGEGDVVGLLLHMPEGGRPIEVQNQDVVRFKGNLYYVNEPEPKPEPLQGSMVAFSLNGAPQGPAFRDILEGTYYPAASLYTMPEQAEGATVTFNFGPAFAFAPPQMEGCPPPRAWCELAQPAPPATAPAEPIPATAEAS